MNDTIKTNSVSTQNIMLGGFIKYNKLDELVKIEYPRYYPKSINLYIDLYSMCKTLFSDSYRTDISDYTAMSRCIIDMCGHYRAFFKGKGIHTKIYLIFSYNNNDIYRQFVPDYNHTFCGKAQSRMISSMVNDNCKILKVICDFINDVFFIQTEYEPATVMDYLMDRGDDHPNIVLSKDIYPSQLTYLHASTAYIKPKKLKGEDVSVVIPHDTHIEFIDRFWQLYCTRAGKISRQAITVHPCNYTLLAAMHRLPERDLNTIANIKTANKLIYEVVGDSPVKLSAASLFKYNANAVKKLPDVNTIANRQRVLDVEFFKQIYENSIESKTLKLTNINDDRTLCQLCDSTFSEDPIDLSRLM